jgi:hypothetical protein
MKYLITDQWILGFVDGEGCFHIGITKSKTMKLGYQILPEFSIVQHERDVNLLYAIRDYFNCGIVLLNRGKNDYRHAPRWNYRVRAKKELLEIIIPFFDKYPLLTVKQKDFLLFKEVMEIIKQGDHLTLEGINKIKLIKNSMNKNRVFRNETP